MYVPGKLHDVEHVLINVGTGYYIEKTAEDAKGFFKRKMDFFTKQMEKMQPALQEKHATNQAAMEMMGQKRQQLTALGESQAGSALSEQSPMLGSNSRIVRPEPKPRVRRLIN
uniref:Prefoldin subunit 5 n=1 Tax=Lynx canadensis TaxID=61383 RepID=A0A667HY37_LYNCA